MNKQQEALNMAIEEMQRLRMRSPIIYEESEAEKACKEALEHKQIPLTEEEYKRCVNESTKWTSSLPMLMHLLNKHFGIDDGLDWSKTNVNHTATTKTNT